MIKTIEEADFEWMCDEFEGDLKKLFREADGKENSISRKIVENIDEWLRDELK